MDWALSGGFGTISKSKIPHRNFRGQATAFRGGSLKPFASRDANHVSATFPAQLESLSKEEVYHAL
jgi:hypothetical protein